MGHVFISYARADRDYAAHVARLLSENGVSVWLDDRIELGSHYDEVIEKALDEADRVVVLWSASSVRSNWVRAEAGEGLRRGVLVPIAVDEAKIPLEFRRVQALDFSNWSKTADEPVFRSLVDHLLGSGRDRVTGGTIQAEARAPVSASLVSASRFTYGVKIRLNVGDRSYLLEHSNLGISPVVKLDGRTVAKGRPFSFQDYFLLEDVIAGVKRTELFLRGDLLLGVDQVRLRADGREVLNEAISTVRGVVIIVILIVLFALAIEPVFQMFGG